MYSLVFIVGTTVNRAGAYEDIPTITKTFETLFDSEVHNWTDFENAQQLRSKVSELKTSDIWLNKFEQAQFVAIFCMAHGGTDGIVQLFKSGDIRNVKKSLLNPFFRIEQLNKKLKWLVVQSCRGQLNDLDFDTDGPIDRYYLDHYCVSYCTGEGTISYQTNPFGKVYLQKLCEELRKNAKTETLRNMLTNVGAAVKKYGEENRFDNYSIPCVDTNCKSDYKFFD